MDLIEGILAKALVNALPIIESFWWVIAIVLFVNWFKGWWLKRVRTAFIANIDWILLEVKIPKENVRPPKAMEQVFTALHATYSGGIDKWEEIWIEGKVEEWMSCEMVSSRDGIRFMVKTPRKYRNLVESAFFSQYPEAEIVLAEEYVSELGELPNEEYDIWGSDLLLARESAYPLKTHRYFSEGKKIEEGLLDPIAMIAEVMSLLKEDERLWIQILIRPTGDGWKKEAEKIVGEKMGRKKKEEKKEASLVIELGLFLWQVMTALFVTPSEVKKEEEKPEKPATLTDSEKKVVEEVELKASKVGFETVVRILYIDKKNAFTRENVSAISGAFRQFDTQHLNAFKGFKGTKVSPSRWFFKGSALLRRKKNMYANYLKRSGKLGTVMGPAQEFVRSFYADEKVPLPVLNAEELATLFHPPITEIVAAQGLRSVEVVKGGPPPNLPISP